MKLKLLRCCICWRPWPCQTERCFFFWGNRKGEIPYWLYIKLKKVKANFTASSRNKKGDVKNKRGYKWLSIHAFIASICVLFVLCKAKTNSFLKMAWQACKEGLRFLKMKSLRTIHILQQPRIIISMKNGRFNCLLKEMNTSLWFVKAGINRPIEVQNCTAMGHKRKRCSRVSSEWWLQRTQLCDWSSIPFLLSKSLVLNLSFRRSQKKNLMFVLTAIFSKPHISRWHSCISCEMFVSSRTWKQWGTPNVCPNVLIRVKV